MPAIPTTRRTAAPGRTERPSMTGAPSGAAAPDGLRRAADPARVVAAERSGLVDVVAYVIGAVLAVLLAVTTKIETHRTWGLLAAGPYLAGAVAATWCWR